jgi:hypothetical protein
MKKLVLILASIFALSGLSHAQRFTVGAAIGLTNGPTPQFSVMVGANDIVKALFIGVDARLEGNLNLGSSSVVSLGAAVLGTVNLGIVTVYGGPQVNFALVNSSFSVGAVGGLRYSLILGLSAFLEGGVLFTDPLGWRIRAGASFSL